MIQHITRTDIRKTLLSPGISTLAGLLFTLALPILRRLTSPEVADFMLRGVNIFLVASLAWFATRALSLMEIVIQSKFDLSSGGTVGARRARTQFVLFKRLLLILIIFIAFSIILLSFDEFRRIGTSLLASVGLVGIIVGVSAQRTAGALWAGIQLAISQPIKIDDVLVVEGEWGRVEDITFSYVVLRSWDLRRIVLPTTYFLEKPFQNWTKVSSDLIATVFFRVDFSADVEKMREYFFNILGESPLWDGKSKAFQATNCDERSLEVRALMSVSDGSSSWELRCQVRESMLAWLRDYHPEWLPKVRIRDVAEEKELFSSPNG